MEPRGISGQEKISRNSVASTKTYKQITIQFTTEIRHSQQQNRQKQSFGQIHMIKLNAPLCSGHLKYD